MRRLLKKDVKWDWTPEIDKDLEKLKREITEAPCLAHFDPKKIQLHGRNTVVKRG